LASWANKYRNLPTIFSFMANNIVILDCFTLNPGDMSLTPFEKLGSVTYYDRTPVNKIIERSLDAEILLTNKTPLSSETIAALPKLKYIGVLATGYNIVDVKAAKDRMIPVTNVPEYSTLSVAQHAISLLLEIVQQTGHLSKTVNHGRWSSCADFSYWDKSPIELAGKTLGIVGAGKIGKAIAKIAEALEMRVQFATRTGGDKELEHVLRTSDVISLNCPLTTSTKEIINEKTISWMKSHAILINTSRGGLIHEGNLADALNSNRIAAAGLDVLSTEPPAASNPLLKAKNCIITPHIAWASAEARFRLIHVAASNIEAYIRGSVINQVN